MVRMPRGGRERARRLSVGAEGLYGEHETKNGHDGDVLRLQLGLVYSIFD